MPAGAWYADAVNWACGAGYVNGYGDRFGPEEPITRQDLATILYRYARRAGRPMPAGTARSPWPDAGEIAAYAAEAVYWAVDSGIINGTDGGYLKPAATATRAQVAAMLERYICKV